MNINIRNYTKIIKKDVILDGINLHFESGRVYGIKGKNGSGKTMLLRAITGLINATEGHVEIDGKVVGKDIEFPPSIGAIIENPGFIPGYSGKKNLEVLAAIKGIISDEDIEWILRKVGLEDVANKKFREYSLGMKQKLGLAAALMENPELVILDEPTNALDEKSVEQLRGIINECKSKDQLVILTCHDSEELELLSDEIITIENGRIVA